MASSDYTDERKALRAKTAQLKALRLAQEAKVSAEQEAKPSASGPAARKVVKKKKRTPAPWPWAATAKQKTDKA